MGWEKLLVVSQKKLSFALWLSTQLLNVSDDLKV